MTYKNSKISQLTSFFHLDFFWWFVIFLIATGVILLERLTPVCITNFYVRLFFYMVSGCLLVFWISWILFGFKAVRLRFLIFTVTALLCVSKAVLTWGGDWKTQTVLYQNRSDDRTVDFQLRADWFAFGYKKRVVARKKIVPFFDFVSDVDTTQLHPNEWQRINRTVNAMGLPDLNTETSQR